MTLTYKGNSLPSVEAEGFEGPLDLLLDEVRRQNVSIEKIRMAPIVTRFLEYVRAASERNLNLDIEWLHMAATLIHWKSRSLLPQNPTREPAADPLRDSLVEQLLAHRKQVAEELSRLRALEQTQFSRIDGEFHQVTGAQEEPDEAPFVSVWDLIQQARDISRWAQKYRANERQPRETLGVASEDVTVSDMIDYLWARLVCTETPLDGARLIHEQPTASHRASLFLGILELARVQRLDIEQKDVFGPVQLWREKTVTADPSPLD